MRAYGRCCRSWVETVTFHCPRRQTSTSKFSTEGIKTPEAEPRPRPPLKNHQLIDLSETENEEDVSVDWIGSESRESARTLLKKKHPPRPKATRARNEMKTEENSIYVFRQDLFSNPYMKDSIPHSLSLSTFPLKPLTTDETGSAEGKTNEGSMVSEDNHYMRQLNDHDPDTLEHLTELTCLLDLHSDSPPQSIPIKHIINLYITLPQPRASNLSRQHLTTLLTLLSRQNKNLMSIAEAYLLIINDLRDNHTPIRQYEYSSLIDFIGKGFIFNSTDRMDKAMQVLADMKRAGHKPEIVTMTTLLSSAIRDKNRPIAAKIIQEMKEHDIPANIITWTERIKLAAQKGNVKHVHATFREFCATGIPVDIVFINELLKAFLSVGQPALAELIYLRLRGFAQTCFKKGVYPRPPDRLTSLKERREAVSEDFLRRHRQRLLEQVLSTRRILGADLFYADGTPTMDYKTILQSVALKSTPISTMLIPRHGTIRPFITYH